MELRKLTWILGAAFAVAAGGVAATACSNGNGSNGNDAGSGDDSSVDSPSTGDDSSSDGGSHDGTAAQDSGSNGDSGNESDGSNAGDGQSVQDGGAPHDAGPDVVCNPPVLTPSTAGSLFCSSTGGDGGGSLVCGVGQQCCLGGTMGSGFYGQQCQARGTTCTNEQEGGSTLAIPISCYQISDCTANGTPGPKVACCLQGGSTPAPVTGCTYDRSKYGSAVVCESSSTETDGGDAGDEGGSVADGSAEAGTDGGDAGPVTAGTCATGEVQLCLSNADCPTGKTCNAGLWKIYDVGFCL